MPYDAFLVSKIVREIETPTFLTGIHQGKRGTLVFCLKSQDVVLDMKIWPHIHVTKKAKVSPENPTPFVSIMRAKLKGGVLTNVKQVNFDRVVEFTFEVKNLVGDTDVFKVYHEVTGAFGNLILTQNSKCVAVFKNIISDKRTIARGAVYEPPFEDRKKISQIDMNFFDNSSEKLHTFLVRHVRGLSKKDAVQITKRVGMSFDTNVALMNEEEKKRVIRALNEIERESAENGAYVLLEGGKAVDVYAFKPVGKCKRFARVSNAIETLLIERKAHDLLQEKRNELNKTVKKLILKTESTLEKIRKELLACEGAEEFKEYGELIISQLYALPKKSERVEITDWKSGKRIKIELDPKISVLQNAQHFFDVYSKMKRKEEGTKRRLKIVEKRLIYFEELLEQLKSSDGILELLEIENELTINGFIKKRKKRIKHLKESQPLEIEYEGFKILIGKNNIQNDRITMKIASRDDLWFHAREVPGAHVVVIKAGREIPKDVIEMAASLAAGHSRYKDSPWVDVDYTEIKNVSKPRASKPGFVLYRKFKTVRVKPKR